MYLDNLSYTLLHICESKKLSYEKLAEKLDMSSRFIGKVIRRESNVTLKSLEKMCKAFDMTPNQLLRQPEAVYEELDHRDPLCVLSTQWFRSDDGKLVGIALCPRCGNPLMHDDQPYCEHCGQMLDWSKYNKDEIIEEIKMLGE